MKFEIDTLLAEAMRRSGDLRDFGAADFRPPLQALLSALDTEGKLSEIGRQILGERIIELLRNRLVIEAYYRNFPQIEEERIERPIVIVGLPRTGTTLLQRILGCDARLYPLYWWETRFPAPLADTPPGQPDPRIELARTEVAGMLEAMPRLKAIHPLDAEAPDEEGMLLEHSFCAFFDAYADIPGYTAWLWNNDQTPAYEYLKRMLKFLQWQKRQRGETASLGRWVLKTPHHLRQIAVLFKVFPDAQVIQTHRDPLQTIPSIASFNETLWQIYGRDVDATRVGRQWSAILARGMRETMAWRDQHGAGRFLDIWFSDTLAKPLEVVQAIYDFAGLSLPDGIQERMQVYLEQNRRDQRPLHEYSLAHYGLSEAQIADDFAAYRQRYILARQD
ncbi:Sulfotransferase [Sterolibacterium denitrificans]|uniref:Sulfotransferase n=2 Tax=Sterolibacterium denitrificans TaxID=157592 RepID=A0A7Z7HP15_9PROT|nr:sulfotransferase [Sterolibacterium denitrificans]KYC29040.1 hypothetical protein ACY05_00120 [Sterolibacterium denitrificans]SMB21275.1 Sulfotransferase [Sterolibacterium denitrificans]